MIVLLSIVIVAIAMWTFIGTFTSGRTVFEGANAAAQKEAYERQKDLLMIVMGLLGTVMGYYFGRVPAELRAQTAERTADKAQADLSATTGLLTDATSAAATATQAAQSTKQEARDAADAALAALNSSGGGSGGTLESTASQGAGDVDQARQHLERLRRRMS